MIRELAENANTYQPLGPDEERVVDDRFVVWFGPTATHPAFTVVQRLRLEAERVEETVGEIRTLVRSHGREACTWEVASSAVPPDLVARLRALGCEPDREPYAVGMVLRRAARCRRAGRDGTTGGDARRASNGDSHRCGGVRDAGRGGR